MRDTRFRVPAAASFRAAWQQEYDKDRPRYTGGTLRSGQPVAEAWRRHGEILRVTWEAFMEGVLSTPTWLALRLLLERRQDLRWLWIRPGGFFFTRANNPRKIRREKLRPRITVTVSDRVTRAESLYASALGEEGEGFTSALLVITLALSGAIQSGEAFTDERMAPVKIRHTRPQLVRKRENRWPWPRSLRARLRGLRGIGLLEAPGDKAQVQ